MYVEWSTGCINGKTLKLFKLNGNYIMTHTTKNSVSITPELASQWLTESKGNRHISKSWVEKLKADMIAGDWQYNGDRIRFLTDDTLHDGHHRLQACVESGVTIISDVVVIPHNAKSTVDKGKARSTADNLVLEMGVPANQAAAIAAAIRMLTSHDNTEINDWARADKGDNATARFLTEQAVQKYFVDHYDEITQASEWTHETIKGQNVLVSKAQAIVFLVLASRQYGYETAYDFLNTVCTGYDIEKGTNADSCRHILLSVKLRQTKMRAQHKLYTVIKNYKSAMAGRTIKHRVNARFRPGVEVPPRFDSSSKSKIH